MRTRPTQCDVCGSPKIAAVENKIMYGKNIGNWPLVWYCYDCKACVNCHPQSDKPMGIMANEATRRSRSAAHKVFDKLWKEKFFTRTGAYEWLCMALNLPRQDCHISHFGIEQCELVEKLVKEELKYRRNHRYGFKYEKGKKVHI